MVLRSFLKKDGMELRKEKRKTEEYSSLGKGVLYNIIRREREKVKLCYGRVTVSGMKGYQLNIKFFQAIDKDMPGDF